MSEEDNQVVEATIPTEEELVESHEEETPIDTEDVEALKSELEKERTAKAQILARAKKAEGELKQFKTPKPTQVTNNKPVLSEEDVDTRVDIKILKAGGMSDELLDELKALAKVRNKSLIETQTDPIFIALKEAKEAEAKAQKAKLGASKGSGSVKKEETFTAPGLSDEKHKELWKQQTGR